MIPASNLLSESWPYSRYRTASYVEDSIEGQDEIHSGFTPVALSRISAICPPSCSTVTRKPSFSREDARHPWKLASDIRIYYAYEIGALADPRRLHRQTYPLSV